jgi:hypothetical protein
MLTKLQEGSSDAQLLAQLKISIRRGSKLAAARYRCRCIAAFSMLTCSLASLQSTLAQAPLSLEPNRSTLEPVRSSTSRSEFAGFRPLSTTPLISLGPFQGSADLSLGFEYTDNANLNNTSNGTANSKQSRFQTLESLDLDLAWVISALNRVKVRVGASLAQTLVGPGGSQTNLTLAPDSEIRFQVQISNLRLSFFDQFSYINDPVSNASTSNTTNLNSFTNIGGVRADWDLNFTIFSLFFDDTYNTQSPSGGNGATATATSGNRNTYRVGSSFTFALTPTVDYGVQGTATLTDGTSSGTSTSTSGTTNGEVKSLNVGPFLRGHLTRLIDVDLTAGVTFLKGQNAPPIGYYVGATVRHQINRNWQYFFVFTHDTSFSSGIDLTEQSYFELGTQYALKFISMSGGPFYTIGNNLNGGPQAQQGKFSQFGVIANLGWSINKHTSATVGYRYVRRDSDTRNDSYTQNLINFQIGYVF